MNNRLVISIALAGVFLLYFPVLGNGFLTDDYAALYRLLIEKRVLFEEMVRPLIDISFYFNYLVFGLHPVGYYVFNLCIHALSCFMVYRVALDVPVFDGRRRRVFALTAGFLFLFYPFHNEGVVWLSGRLSSMAALFGLMAIHFALTKKRPWNVVLGVGCWWIGLFAYESIIILPAVVLLFEWLAFRDVRRGLRSFAVWAVAGILWLGMRYVAAGELLPKYGQSGLAGDAVWLRFLKVLGRCFLPPEENGKLMMGLFGVVVVVIVVLHLLVWKRGERGLRRKFFVLEAAFLVALLPAVAFAVSTRTSEGDRLLYFPSAMLCVLAGAVVVTLLPGRRWRFAVCGGYAVLATVFIQANNRRWVFASRAAEATLALVRSTPGRVVLVNVPDEWEGAYIFRNNFNEGLVVNGIDTNRVHVSHVLTRLEYLRVDGPIVPVKEDSLFAEGRVFYWNKYEWKELILR